MSGWAESTPERKAHIERVRQAVQLAVQERGFAARRHTEQLRNPELISHQHDAMLQHCIDLLLTERAGDCTITECRCTVDFTAFAEWSHVRAPKPVRCILAHQFYHGEVWLYCRLDTDRAVPEFRRQCQVDIELVRDYRDKLIEEGRSPRLEEVWTIKDELRVRKNVFDELDKKQTLINQQLAQCHDTAEWDRLTKNAKALGNITIIRRVDNNSRPDPIQRGEHKVYIVEAIWGATMNKGKLWFLIKWEGYESKDNSWELESAFKSGGSKSMMMAFYEKYGKPSWITPEVLSPEGVEHTKWVKGLEAKEAKEKELAAGAEKAAVAAAKAARAAAAAAELGISTNGEPSTKKRKPGRPVMSATPRPGPDPKYEEEEFYEVERIIGAKLRTGKIYYLVKWLGWESKFNTWEPPSSVKMAQAVVKSFIKEHGKPTVEQSMVLSAEGRIFEQFNRANKC